MQIATYQLTYDDEGLRFKVGLVMTVLGRTGQANIGLCPVNWSRERVGNRAATVREG